MSGNPVLLSLPKDDQLRIVVWTGRVTAQSSQFKTPRFTCWLRRIDVLGNYVDDRVLEIIESVGAISLFPLGACFKDQQRVSRVDKSPAEIVSIKVPERWLIRRVIDKSPITSQSYISPLDMPLKLTTFQEEEVRGYDAWLVVAETTEGKQILMPCSEVFRAFYAASSAQAIGIFRKSWSNSKKDFLEASNQSIDDKGRIHWHLDLKAGVPTSIARSLCWLEFVPGASTIADQTCTSLVNQMQMRVDPWIKASPPISAGILSINAQLKSLPRSKALLVTQIHDFKPDIQVFKITCTVPERTVLVGIGEEKPGGDKPKPVPGPKPKPGPIGKPQDRRPTHRHFDFSGDQMLWSGLPQTEVSAKRLKELPIPGKPVGPRDEVEVESSVGEASGTGKAQPSAQITPQVAERLRNRFEDVIATLNRLVELKLINRWSYCPIYRPLGGMYCEFPQLMPSREHPKAARWCRVDGDSRVALVLSLELRARTIYWIEIESVPRDFKALAFEMLDGDPLDELTLSSLLEGCANSEGKWNVKLEFGRSLKMVAKRHASNREKELSVNVFMGAIAELGAMSGQPKEVATEIAQAPAGPLTVHVALNAVIPH